MHGTSASAVHYHHKYQGTSRVRLTKIARSILVLISKEQAWEDNLVNAI